MFTIKKNSKRRINLFRRNICRERRKKEIKFIKVSLRNETKRSFIGWRTNRNEGGSMEDNLAFETTITKVSKKNEIAFNDPSTRNEEINAIYFFIRARFIELVKNMGRNRVRSGNTHLSIGSPSPSRAVVCVWRARIYVHCWDGPRVIEINACMCVERISV